MASPKPRTAALGAAGLTAVVWATRVANALGDDDATTAATVGSLVLALSFLTLAALVALAAFTRRDLLFRSVLALTVWTVAVWAVRMVDIAGSDRGAGFVVVHLALAVLSVAACGLALRELAADRDGFLGRRLRK